MSLTPSPPTRTDVLTNIDIGSLWGASTSQSPADAEADALFHHKLTMQSNSYMNATFSVCAARCGMDDGKYNLIGGSCIVDPEGKILAEAKTKEDEVVTADLDLEACRQGKTRTFDFARHRRVEHYERIVNQTGVIEPPCFLPSASSGIVHVLP